MPASELTKPYEPNALLRAVYARFFDNIQVDEAWIREVRRLSNQGTVLYVLRSLNFVDFLALDHLTKRHGLPQIHFANDLGLWVLNPMGKGWLNAIVPSRNPLPADDLRAAIARGGSAALFLKRPPNILDVAAGATRGRGVSEGNTLVEALLELQPRIERPILLVPQVFVWSKQAERRRTQPLDLFFGPSEWPSPARTVAQFLYNHKHVALRLGEPLNLAEFLQSEQSRAGGPVAREVLVRRVTYAVLRRLERERRVITGPAEKPPDRVRRELVRTPRLRQTIVDLAGESPEDREVWAGRALEMLRELQATPTKSAQKVLEVVLDRIFHRMYAGIDYDPADFERVREVARKGTLVLLPSHKSHVDYLVLSYVFNELNLPLPRIAAGDNLNFFPVGELFRRAGAFFIRRSFKGDRLYGAVVDAYIRRLLRDGSPIELFLEGGRSRTGRLLPPKFGLLNMIVEAALGLTQTSTYFVPVSIGYERVIEASSYERELQGAEKQKEDTASLLRSGDILRHRYGRINLQVGEILSLDELRSELQMAKNATLLPARRRALVTRLGNRTMDEINRVTAVTPGALTALALLTGPDGEIPHVELVEACRRFHGILLRLGARVTPSAQTASGVLREPAIREAVQLFLDGDLIQAHSTASDGPLRWRRSRLPAGPDAAYSVPASKRLLLDTTKNIILHFFVERALVAFAVGSMANSDGSVGSVQVEVVKVRVQALSRLLKYEFRFQADRAFDEIFASTLDAMRNEGTLRQEHTELYFGEGRAGWSGRTWVARYCSMLWGLLEGYRAAARSLEVLLKSPVSEKDLVRRALVSANRMFAAAEIKRREAINQFSMQNAFRTFTDQGYLALRAGKVELNTAFSTPEAVHAIEDRIASFLNEASSHFPSAVA